MAENYDDRLDVPRLRYWELDENSTRYDRLVAAPSDQELWYMWLFWGILTGAVAVFVMGVFLAVISSRRARKSPFNLYLLYLMLPDAFYSGMCLVSCVLNLTVGHYYSENWCRTQSFYLIFGIGKF